MSNILLNLESQESIDNFEKERLSQKEILKLIKEDKTKIKELKDKVVKRINIRNCNSSDDLPSLKEFKYVSFLMFSDVKCQITTAISKLKGLNYLVFERCNYQHGLPDILKRMNRLKGLSFLDSNFTFDQGYEDIPNLEKLSIIGKTDINILKDVNKLSLLKELIIENNSDKDKYIIIPDNFFNLTNLEIIKIKNYDMSKNHNVKDNSLAKLNILELVNNRSMSNTILNSFLNAPKLETLNLTSNKINSVPDFSNSTKITDLKLNNNLIKDGYCNISNLNLEYFDISNNNLSQESIEELFNNIKVDNIIE